MDRFMDITERNLKLVKAFIHVLQSLNTSTETIHLIIAVLKDEQELGEMLHYIDKNREANEQMLIHWATDKAIGRSENQESL